MADRGAGVRLPYLKGIRAAAATIGPHHTPSPLIRSELLSRAFDADVWLKNETVGPVASFKLRGALNALLLSAQADPATGWGAVSSSTGNHGQGVAYAARLLSRSADVFLPDGANPIKAKMIAALGAQLHIGGEDIDAAKALAREFCDRHGHRFIDDGDDVDVIEGSGTVALEVGEALENVDALVVPLGAGTFVGGCAAALKGLQPAAQVIAVQAKGSPAMVESFHAGRPIERPIDTIAGGLATRIPPAHALAAMLEYVDDAWLVSDDELLSALRTLAECAHVMVEPAGAASTAGAWARRQEFRGKRVVLVLSGSNVTREELCLALDAAPMFELDDVS